MRLNVLLIGVCVVVSTFGYVRGDEFVELSADGGAAEISQHHGGHKDDGAMEEAVSSSSSSSSSTETAGHSHGHSHGGGHSHGHSHGGGHSHSHGQHEKLKDEDKHVWTAVFLTTLSGLAAVFGGVIVIMFGVPDERMLGHLLSFAAGIMMYVSYGDLLPHATGAPPDGIGFFYANAWMFAGMLFFALVVLLVPEPELIDVVTSDENDADKKATKSRNRLMVTGIIAAIGISLHNMPEGLVVYNATIGGVCREDVVWTGDFWQYAQKLSSACMGRGLVITWAIALHNIPEGMAVASPIFSATKSKWQAIKWCFLSSICEPIAAILFGIFFNSYLTLWLMSALNAAVAGIMIMLCLVELIPASMRMVSPKAAVFSNLLGQVVMAYSLHEMYNAGVH